MLDSVLLQSITKTIEIEKKVVINRNTIYKTFSTNPILRNAIF